MHSRPTTSRTLRHGLLAVSLTLLAWFHPANAATFIVGVGTDCTHDDLQQALLSSLLNGPGNDEIRLVRNMAFTGEFLIDNQSVTLVGGYDSCTDTTASGRTVVTREFDGRAFSIRGSVNGSQTIQLNQLDIRFDGAVSVVQDEGGMVHLSDQHLLILNDSNVEGGAATRGGGLFVEDSTLLLNHNSTVLDNTAQIEGGGIYCRSNGEVVLIEGLIAVNEADYGGGLGLTDGCQGTSFAGGFLEGIAENDAFVAGGGVFVEDALFSLVGDSSPATVQLNEAPRGGGLFASGFGTEIQVTNGVIANNTASEQGGGLYLESSSLLQMTRTLGASCHDPVRCSRLSGNSALATTGKGGGAVYLYTGADARITQTYLEGNVAENSAVVAVDLGGTSELTLEGVVIAGNRGDEMIHVEELGSLRAGFITVADNEPPPGSSAQQRFLTATGTAPNIEIYSSIIHDPGGPVVGVTSPGTTATYDCLIVHSDLGLGSATGLTETDPLFLNRQAGDYHLSAQSPAIDYCDTTHYTPLTNDIDFEARGTEQPVPNHFGPYDLGADEFGTEVPFFSDGFESGTTSGWSSSTS